MERQALGAADLSQSAVNRAVTARALQHPLTLYSGVVGVLLAGAGIVFAVPAATIAGAALAVVVGIGGTVFNLRFRRNSLARTHIDRILRQQERGITDYPAQLRAGLEEQGSELGLRQLAELEDSFKDFETLLRQKFSPDSVTLGRLLGTAEQVHMGGLKKLGLVIAQLKAVESIPRDLADRLAGIDPAGKAAQDMRQRLQHREEALANVARLHDEIESSLTRISAISVAVAGIGGDDTNSRLHEECLAEMQELVATSDAFRQARV